MNRMQAQDLCRRIGEAGEAGRLDLAEAAAEELLDRDWEEAQAAIIKLKRESEHLESEGDNLQDEIRSLKDDLNVLKDDLENPWRRTK